MRIALLVAFQLICQITVGQALLNQPITISFKNQDLQKCLQKIEQQADISFSYNSKQISVFRKPVTEDFAEIPLSRVLDVLLKDTRLAYKEIGGQITIYEVKSAEGTVLLTGYVRNAKSKEELVGARIYFPELQIGCISNSYGYYAIELPKGSHRFVVSSLGMTSLRDSLFFQEDMVLHLLMEESTLELVTVPVVSMDSIRVKTETTDLSNADRTTITRNAILRLPAAGGEVDVLKYVQQFPGVQASNDGGANFQVRGSGTGNNLILLDEIPIYHPTHMLGVYSIVNIDAVKSAELYKDYIPTRYGARNASVLQIQTKEGDLQKYHLTGGLSFISGRMNIEGPLVRNKASFYLSGRKSFFPGVGSQLLNSAKFTYPSYYDLNAKVNVHLNSNNRIYLTGYFGQDQLEDTTLEYKWGNIAGAFRWNHIFSSKTFSNLNVTHSEFNYSYASSFSFKDEVYGQKVVTDKINYNFTNFYRPDLRIDYGVELAWIRTRKGSRTPNATDLFLERNAFENGLYASIDKKISPRLNVKAGLRVPFSFHLGTQDTTTYLNHDLSQTTVIYEKNKLYDFMVFADPRVLASYNLTESDRFQMALSVASQHTHIINYINYFLPIEIWTTSNAFLKPERSYSQSITWIHDASFFESSLTAFNRHVRNVIDYATPVYTSSQDIESNILTGNMNAFGFECQINFNKWKQYSASLSYTYIHTQQSIKGINNNEPYVVTNDRPHYFAFSQYFVASPKWKVSTNLIVHSGTATTLPNGQFIINGTTFPLFPVARNAERLPFFARFDISFTRQLGLKKKRDRYNLVFTLTNLFNRNNPSVVYVDKQFYSSDSFVVKSVNYAPFMLSLNLNYKF